MRLLRNLSSIILCFFFFFFCLLSFDALKAEDVYENNEDGEDVNQGTETPDDDEEKKSEEEEIEEKNEEDEDHKDEKDDDEKETDADKNDGGQTNEGGDDKKEDDEEENDDKNEEVEVDGDKRDEGEIEDDEETVEPESEVHNGTTWKKEEVDEEEKEKEEEEEQKKKETVLETDSKNKDGETDEGTEESESEQTAKEADKETVERVWSYRGRNGPGNWSKNFDDCQSGDQRFQSPININTQQTTLSEDQLEAIELITVDNNNTTIAHDDLTVKLSFDKIIRIDGLGLTYRVDEVRFHWGETETTGSEHSIDGKRYPLEMQIFAYDEDGYASFEEAIRVSDGNDSSSAFLVLATLFELSATDNPSLTEITKNLESIQNPGDSVVVASFELKDLLPEKTDYYFRYTGSLTFPPCIERADWIVFHERQTISSTQLEQFRHLHEERRSDDEEEESNSTLIAFNYRPVQPLNGRIVTRSFPGDAVPHVGTNTVVEKTDVEEEEEETKKEEGEEPRAPVDPKPPASAIGNGNAATAIRIQMSVSLAFPLLALCKVIIR